MKRNILKNSNLKYGNVQEIKNYVFQLKEYACILLIVKKIESLQ